MTNLAIWGEGEQEARDFGLDIWSLNYLLYIQKMSSKHFDPPVWSLAEMLRANCHRCNHERHWPISRDPLRDCTFCLLTLWQSHVTRNGQWLGSSNDYVTSGRSLKRYECESRWPLSLPRGLCTRVSAWVPEWQMPLLTRDGNWQWKRNLCCSSPLRLEGSLQKDLTSSENCARS